MKEMIRYGLILGTMCVVAGGLLAFVNSATKAKIIAQAQAEESSALKEVMPEAVDFKPVSSEGTVLYYNAIDAGGTRAGVVFKASGKGYGGQVDTMVGMTPEGVLTAIKVIAHTETPGLGSRIAQQDFIGRFSGKPLGSIGSVEAISGATISSRAVIDSVEKKAQEIKGLIDNGQ